MASFWDVQNQNKWQSYLLVALMMPIIIGLAWFASWFFEGGELILPFAILFSIVYSIGGYFYGDKIVLATTGAKLAQGNDYVYLQNVTEGLALAAGIPKPKLYVIEDQSPNAFATGRDPKHASIAVTRGLIDKMNRAELEGVIAHEMSHIKNFDIRFMTTVVVLVGLVAILSQIIGRMFFFSGGRGSSDKKGGNAIIMVIGILLVILGPIAAHLVKFAISRKREYLADASAAQLTRNPDGLASALEKLKSAPAMAKSDDATASLFISNPAGSKKSFSESISGLFSTHPPLDERIKILRSM